jgi:hypothetical protein
MNNLIDKIIFNCNIKRYVLISFSIMPVSDSENEHPIYFTLQCSIFRDRDNNLVDKIKAFTNNYIHNSVHSAIGTV